jgi:hypothetical protein
VSEWVSVRVKICVEEVVTITPNILLLALIQFTHSLTHSLTALGTATRTDFTHCWSVGWEVWTEHSLPHSLTHSLTHSLMSMYTNRVCMRVARARTSLSNHCFTHSFCTLPHSLTPVEKKSKRAAKKAAFGSQKGVDITSRSDSYSAWWVSECVCVCMCVLCMCVLCMCVLCMCL